MSDNGISENSIDDSSNNFAYAMQASLSAQVKRRIPSVSYRPYKLYLLQRTHRVLGTTSNEYKDNLKD